MLHDHSKDRRRPHVRMQPSTILDQQDDEGDVSYFDDQDHMDHVGEFTFTVNETCLTNDHNIFMVAPTDKDAHNPILVHLKPSDMIWKEKRTYIPRQKKQERKERRKAIQKSNRIKGLAKVLYWTSLGATGMVLPNGCRMTLVMVVPHLCC